MLQKRAFEKYHCPGLRANTTCSHPRKGEFYEEAAHRRLQEEMGFDCPLEEKFHFIYKAEFDNGLTEHELDRVFVGTYDGEVIPNAEEVAEYKRISLESLKKDMKKNADLYAPWFHLIMEKML